MKILSNAYRPDEFAAYLQTLKWGAWKPSLVVIHHCAAPSLAQRPHGFQSQHMRNLQSFYESKGWSAGPHLFTDDDQVWTFSPMTACGVHAVSFNSTGIGIEMLGDYDTEDPWTGRGLQVLTTTCLAVKAILARLQLTPAAIRFHRDDPRTTKTCPGKKITKDAFLAHIDKV
jgi:hypothetical protein